MTLGLMLAMGLTGVMLSIVVSRRTARGWMLLLLGGLSCTGVAAGLVLVTGGSWIWQSGWLMGGEEVALRLDGLSALFLVLVVVIGGAGALYAAEYWPDRAHPVSAGKNRGFWSAFIICMGCVLVCANGLHFLIAWELFALCGYFLITLDNRRQEVRSAGWLYLAASHAGTLALFAFFGSLAGRTGSWAIGPELSEAGVGGLFWVALFGFGVKAGMFPLHIWLPSAHANAPSHVSAILSGVAIKMGVYGIVRFSGWLEPGVAAGWVVAGFGVVSAVLGVVFALGQHDLKRLLAYHSVENVGIILIGVGFAMVGYGSGHAEWGSVALAGGLLHVWNHGLFKSLLFLGAGSIVHATGTREMSRLGGLWKSMPWTASMFALGAMAIVGLPPLNGFVSEWLIYLGLLESVQPSGSVGWGGIAALVLMAMTGALALACFVKVCGVVLLGGPRSERSLGAHECGWSMRLPMLVLGMACVVIGLAPLLCWPALRAATGTWQAGWGGAEAPGSLKIVGGIHVCLLVLAVVGGVWLWRRVCCRGEDSEGMTWDCGYAAPTGRMQYTAGSFAGIITEWFAWVLQPVRKEVRPQGMFPVKAQVELHARETVLERVLEPIAWLVMQCSGVLRRLQNGRAQAYLFYLMMGLAAVAAMTALWWEQGFAGGAGR